MDKKTETIGFVGLGRMGRPMASNLCKKGFDLVVHDVNPAVPVAHLREMDEVFTESIRRPRLLAQLLAAFSALSLLLAAIGTYGVLAYMVAERRREIGIRMALGANRSGVIAQVMQQGLMFTTIGVVVGIDALACRRCDRHGPMVCPLGHWKCMREVGVAQVVGAIEKLTS